MEPKLLLIKIVTLLFKESQYKEAAARSSTLVKNVIESIALPEAGVDYDRSREGLQALRTTALWMAGVNSDDPFDRTAILQRIRVNAGDDEAIYYAFEQGTDGNPDEDLLKKQTQTLRSELFDHLDQVQVKSILKKAYYDAAFGNGPQVGSREFIREVYAKLEPYTHQYDLDAIKGSVDTLDIEDDVNVERVLNQAKEEASTEGVISFGIQGINRMTGEHGGILRGETWVVGALQHNFKTGFGLSLLKGAALYNDPWMLDPKKKPLLVHISVEDSLQSNILWLYANLKEGETGQEVNLAEINIHEATQYVKARMTERGYHLKMSRWDPSQVTYHTIQDYIEGLEAEGYEVHLCIFDYLNMINKDGCVQGTAGEDIRDLWRRSRNFFSKRKTAFISPHQLSTDAKNLKRQGVENFVKFIANKGYYDGTKRLDQEVDFEIYIDIEKIDGRSYLTCQRGKHRKPKPTREKDLYCVLPFHPAGAILDDINGQDLSMNGLPGSGSEGESWWQSS